MSKCVICKYKVGLHIKKFVCYIIMRFVNISRHFGNESNNLKVAMYLLSIGVYNCFQNHRKDWNVTEKIKIKCFLLQTPHIPVANNRYDMTKFSKLGYNPCQINQTTHLHAVRSWTNL